MNRNRPSLGEFSGYFNIRKADFRRISGGSWEDDVICDRQIDQPLTSRENDVVKNTVASSFLRRGFHRSDLTDNVEYLWPQPYFSIEYEQIDRSVRVWLSSSALTTCELLEELRNAIQLKFAAWRIILILPRGDQPDIVIYNDSIRIGDHFEFSSAVFEDQKKNWLECESGTLPNRTSQFKLLNGCVPSLFLNPKRTICLLGAFAWNIDQESSSPNSCTVWFAAVGKTRGETRHQFNALETDSSIYRPSLSGLRGTFDEKGTWNFAAPAHSAGNSCYFLVPFLRSDSEFIVTGYDTCTCKEWRFSGNVGNIFQLEVQ